MSPLESSINPKLQFENRTYSFKTKRRIYLVAAFRRRINNKGKLKLWTIIVFFIIVLLLIQNADKVWRYFYPFPYRQITINHAEAYNLDPYLLASIMKAESGFNSSAVSPKGARGLMQIMPDTGQWVARQLGSPAFAPDQLFDPDTNIRFGAWYIADLKKEFHGDIVLVLAAYNGGRGNVEEWVASKNLTGGNSTIDQIPFPETRNFVRKVLLYHRIYSHLYGQEAQSASLQ
ncbi:MAG: lytic transglycosylase domain-containing protein [Peptococcaceae bacterium]|nr:lytic transglycosylase domain-containing protein [Peptococcaceae bacterium]